MQHKVFENEEIRNIYTALGVTIGTEEDSKALNLEKLRYHKIVIMCEQMLMESYFNFNFNFFLPLYERID